MKNRGMLTVAVAASACVAIAAVASDSARADGIWIGLQLGDGPIATYAMQAGVSFHQDYGMFSISATPYSGTDVLDSLLGVTASRFSSDTLNIYITSQGNNTGFGFIYQRLLCRRKHAWLGGGGTDLF